MDDVRAGGGNYEAPESISNVLQVVLAEYAGVRDRRESAGGHPLNTWLRRIPSALGRLPIFASLNIITGQGHGSNWSGNPYIAFLRSDVAPAISSGVYVAYIFRSDMSAVYLSLNQGSQNAAGSTDDKRAALKKCADDFRQVIQAPEGFTTDPMRLLPEPRTPNGRNLEAGNIYSVEYTADNLPSDDALREDLARALKSYATISRAQIDSVIAKNSESFSLHLRPASSRDMDALIAETLWTKEALEEVIAALDPITGSSRQVVLTGPPGTGKTWVAKAIVNYLTDGNKKRSRVVQFHPSYSYEQFMEGLRPILVDGAIKFEPVPGVVLRMAADCAGSPERRYLIIDEMNRANLPRVLGELMYLFEYRDEAIELPYTAEFKLPNNLAFLGTMNTADRSIRAIDLALRRRFDIFECPADRAILERYYNDEQHELTVSDLYDGFDRLNAFLEAKLDRYHTIGQTFFMESQFTEASLRMVWKRRILPTIAEYFFDQRDELDSIVLETFWPSISQA